MTTAMKQNTETKDTTSNISNIASVTDALTEVLAGTYRLVLKSHIYHWNVTGPLFVSLHDMTEAHYSDMFTAADVLAERIRALGKPALVSLATDGQEADASLAADGMIKDLLSDHENLAARMRALVGTAEAADDPVTADLATARADFHEKAAWMLRALAA
ncbi:MAG: DNA starvation/stationary phase protection protein [Paracoccaceae bacterium]